MLLCGLGVKGLIVFMEIFLFYVNCHCSSGFLFLLLFKYGIFYII